MDDGLRHNCGYAEIPSEAGSAARKPEQAHGLPGQDGGGHDDGDFKDAELCLYVAANAEGILGGSGQLYVFKADSGANTTDIQKGADLTGTFAPIDQNDNADQKALQATAD